MHLDIRGQLTGVCSLLLLWGLWDLTQVLRVGNKCLSVLSISPAPALFLTLYQKLEKTLTSRVKICLLITRHCRTRETVQWVKELEQTQTKSGMVAGPCNLFSYSNMGDKDRRIPRHSPTNWASQQWTRANTEGCPWPPHVCCHMHACIHISTCAHIHTYIIYTETLKRSTVINREKRHI